MSILFGPDDGSLRELTLKTPSYPSVAFDRTTQKFACGTSEGAVIVYDLKTATVRVFATPEKAKAVSVLNVDVCSASVCAAISHFVRCGLLFT